MWSYETKQRNSNCETIRSTIKFKLIGQAKSNYLIIVINHKSWEIKKIYYNTPKFLLDRHVWSEKFSFSETAKSKMPPVKKVLSKKYQPPDKVKNDNSRKKENI